MSEPKSSKKKDPSPKPKKTKQTVGIWFLSNGSLEARGTTSDTKESLFDEEEKPADLIAQLVSAADDVKKNEPVVYDNKYILAFDVTQAMTAAKNIQKDEPKPKEEEEASEGDEQTDEEESGGKNEKITKVASLSNSKVMMSIIVNFAKSNAPVGLVGLRPAWLSYVRRHEAANPHLVQQLGMLALTSIGTRKETWSTNLIMALKTLGDIPLIFAGSGGTYKAFLYLGYDIMLHLSIDPLNPDNIKGGVLTDWPAWLVTLYGLNKRTCPNGDIRALRNVTLSTQGAEKTKDKENAISQAQSEFKSWAEDKTLDYKKHITNIKFKADVKSPTEVVTDFKRVVRPTAKK